MFRSVHWKVYLPPQQQVRKACVRRDLGFCTGRRVRTRGDPGCNDEDRSSPGDEQRLPDSGQQEENYTGANSRFHQTHRREATSSISLPLILSEKVQAKVVTPLLVLSSLIYYQHRGPSSRLSADAVR